VRENAQTQQIGRNSDNMFRIWDIANVFYAYFDFDNYRSDYNNRGGIYIYKMLAIKLF